MPARSRALLVVLAAALFAVSQLHGAAHAGILFGDFRAFYCAGAVLAHGGDPYAAAPLYACERVPMPLGLYHVYPGVALPAPLPGYVLLLFVPFGLLPYPLAAVVWFFVLLVTLAVAVWALAALLDRPIEGALAALAVMTGVLVLPFGELGGIELAAVLCAAVAVRRGAWTYAALAGAFAMMLPHVGLPVLIGLFLCVPAIRGRIAAVVVILALLDVLAGGPATAVAYVTRVLPAHAASEIGSTAQYGLTWILHALGAPDRTAIAFGEASYAIMLVLGLAVARRLFQHMGEAAYAVLIPPAFAVFGGTFIHLAQIAVAVPAALLLYRRSKGVLRIAFGCAALLLAMPWLSILGQPLLIPIVALACGATAIWLFDTNASTALRIALGSVAVGGAVLIAGAYFGPALHGGGYAASVQNGLAQHSWGAYMRAAHSSSGPAWWIAKAPTWTGLALVTLGGLYALPKASQSEAATEARG